MLLQLLFVAIGLLALLFIWHACYGLAITRRSITTAPYVTVPMNRDYGARIVAGACLAILSFVGFRWARQRRLARQHSESARV